MEKCSIIVDVRDRFSTMAGCLRTLIAQTPEPYDLIVVVGGAPQHLRDAWMGEFGARARCIFRPAFINQAEARNIGMREAATRLAVLMDSDVYVRPGWLSALIRCQQETAAVMVVPVMLETVRKIHTAGNSLYITDDRGRRYGHKELRYHGMVLGERSNLTRSRTDYGELHCQLVEIEPTLRLGAYDERIVEVGEVDSGLTWSKAGLTMWFEPAAVVYYHLRSPIAVEDIGLFAWRWDMRIILEGYRHFERKWGLDITEHGGFRDFLLMYNGQLGLLPRLFPSTASLWLDRQIGRLRRALLVPCRAPKALLRRYKAHRIGYYAWPEPV